MDESHQTFGQLRDGICLVAVQGKVTAHHSPALRQFVWSAIDDGVHEVQIDLSRCHYGDSTFVGTLLQIRKACGDAVRLQLMAPTPEFENTLKNMGLQRLFDCGVAPFRDDFDGLPLSVEQSGRCSREFCENVATAHRELADSSTEGRDRYLLIAEAAERELSTRG